MAVLLFIVKEMENMISSTLMHSLQQCDFTKCLSDQDYYYLLIFILFLHTGISPKRKKIFLKITWIWQFYHFTIYILVPLLHDAKHQFWLRTAQ